MSKLKELVVVNPKKGTKKAAKKRTTAKKTAAKKAAAKKRTTARKTTTKTTRRKNPGMDVRGTLASVAGGVVGLVAGQVAAHLIGARVPEGKARMAAKAGMGLAVPSAVGLIACGKAPNVAKGLVASGAGLAVAHVLGGLGAGEPGTIARFTGFNTLAGPGDIFEAHGQVFRKLPDGRSQALSGVGELYRLEEHLSGTSGATSSVGALPARPQEQERAGYDGYDEI